MEVFIYRIWGKLGIDKIILILKGIFIVRSVESMEKVLSDGIFMFDKKKSVIIYFWAADLDVK